MAEDGSCLGSGKLYLRPLHPATPVDNIFPKRYMHLFGKEIKIAPHLSRSQKRQREAQIGRIRLVIRGVPKDAQLVAFREIFEPFGDIDSYYI